MATKDQLQAAMVAAATEYGLVGKLPYLYRQCQRESGWCPTACNLCHGPCKQVGDGAHHAKSCYGPMQLALATARELGVDRDDPVANVRGGVRYMASLLARYKGDYAKALASYNWGMGRVDRCCRNWGAQWRQHLPQETTAYVAYILQDGVDHG